MKAKLFYILTITILVTCCINEHSSDRIEIKHISKQNPFINGILKNQVRGVFIDTTIIVSNARKQVIDGIRMYGSGPDTTYYWKFDSFGNLVEQRNYSSYFIGIYDSLGFIDSSIYKDCMYYRKSFNKTENLSSRKITLKSSKPLNFLTPTINFYFDINGYLIEKQIEYDYKDSTLTDKTIFKRSADGKVKEMIETEFIPKRAIANFGSSRRILAFHHLKPKNFNRIEDQPGLIKSYFKYVDHKLTKVTEYIGTYVVTEIFLNESELIDSTITKLDSNNYIIEKFKYLTRETKNDG